MQEYREVLSSGASLCQYFYEVLPLAVGAIVPVGGLNNIDVCDSTFLYFLNFGLCESDYAYFLAHVSDKPAVSFFRVAVS